MIKLNEAPNIVLNALYKAMVKRSLRYFSGPAILATTGTVTVGQWPKKLKSNEKVALKQLIDALENLRVKKCDNKAVRIQWQIEETFLLIEKSLGNPPLSEQWKCLFAARTKIYDKLKEQELLSGHFMRR